MPKPTDYDKTHLRNMAAIGTRIDRIFKKAAEEAAKIGSSIKTPLPEDRIFSFDDFPATQKQIDRLLQALKDSMEVTIVNGVDSAWTLSNNKNNALVARIFGDNAKKLIDEQYRRYFSTNGAALDAFKQRQVQGLNLSDRVWKYTDLFKKEIELALDLGIRSGESAAMMTRSLRKYLQHPDKLFRRVRDQHGNLRLSQAAKAFHPGRGVYRSSYKNARRLAATETNMAYRTSDYLRWQQMDFVVGIEIKLSNNHTLNGVHFTDICDTLKGRYPKDFKFVGWHPHCRCHAISILKTEDEMAEDTRRILAGEKPKKGSVNAVEDVPAAFKDWVEEHSERIEMGGNLPYFIKDNHALVEDIISNLSDKFTPMSLEDVLAKYKRSWVEDDVTPEDFMRMAQGMDIKGLVDDIQGLASKHGIDFSKVCFEMPEANVLTIKFSDRREESELYRTFTRQQDGSLTVNHDVFKIPKEKQGQGFSKEVLRRFQTEYDRMGVIRIDIQAGSDAGGYVWAKYGFQANKQSEVLSAIMDFDHPEWEDFVKNWYKQNGFDRKHPFPMRLIAEQPWGKKALVGTQWEGFLDLRDADQRKLYFDYIGYSPKRAKVLKTKRTIAEITAERHAKRDGDSIQKAWNERRIANIRQAAAKGLLPKGSVEGLSGLSQSELNARIEFLQKTAKRHASRTQQDIDNIQTGWNRKIIRRFEKAIDDGLLPKDARSTLRWMQDSNDLGDFDDFRKRAAILDTAIKRHSQRKQSVIQRIKDQWAQRKKDPEADKIAKVRKAIDKKKIENLSDVQRIIKAFYDQFPEEFNKVYVKITTFNQAPKPGRGFTMGYSRHDQEIAFNTNAGVGYVKESPFDTLVKALNKIRDGKKLTLDQHRSINTVVHELLHQKAGKYVALRPHYAGDFKRTAMETMNEYASRNTHKRFLQRLGATNLEGSEDILRKGDGYQDWVKRLLEFVDTANLKHDEIGKQFAETLLTKPYDTMDRELYDFFKSHVDKKNFTQSMDEVLAALECHDKKQKGKWAKMLRQWFP